MVMHGASAKARQDASRLHPDLPALGVDGVIGQVRRAGDMQPVQLPRHMHATLVEMGHRRVNPLAARLARFGHARHSRRNGPPAQYAAVPGSGRGSGRPALAKSRWP